MNTWNQINASRRRKKSRVRSFETLETRRLPKASIAWTRGLNFSSGAPPLSRLSHGYVIIIHTLPGIAPPRCLFTGYTRATKRDSIPVPSERRGRWLVLCVCACAV